MQSNVLNDLAKAKRRRTGKKKLVGKTPGPDTKLDFDIYDVNIADVLFEGLAGASLLERILLWYQSKEMDIPWFIQGDAGQA